MSTRQEEWDRAAGGQVCRDSDQEHRITAVEAQPAQAVRFATVAASAHGYVDALRSLQRADKEGAHDSADGRQAPRGRRAIGPAKVPPTADSHRLIQQHEDVPIEEPQLYH